MAPPLKNLVGKRYGKLIVLGTSHRDKQSKMYWLCLCDCGKTTRVQGGNLRSGGTLSCGCVQYGGLRRWREEGGEARLASIEKNRKYPNNTHSALVSRHRDYRVGAERRGLVWELTFEQFVSIGNDPCVYCGEPPEPRPYPRGVVLLHSGIDRLDNSLGYSVGNVVPCCTWCNRVKSSDDITQFIRRCKAVADNFGWVVHE